MKIGLALRSNHSFYPHETTKTQNYEAREKAGDIELELRVAEISPMRVIARSLIAPFVSFEIREASGEKAEVLAILGRE